MSLLVVGASHRSSDLALLERLAVPADERRKVLRELVELDHVLEAVVLSTCNRVEVYVDLAKFHPGLDEVTSYLAARAGDRAEDFLDSHEVAYDLDVATHLFRVAGGIESMVVGERQIAMQVRDAMELARHEGTARRMLQRLFRQSVRVGRRLRHETDISAGSSSMVEVALATVTHEHRLPDHPVSLIVGAGKVGTLAAERLASGDDLRVWNRSSDKATRLAARHGARVVDDLPAAVADADLVDAEVAGFSAWMSASEVVPTIRALRRRAESVRTDELDRLGNRLADLTDDQRRAVDALTEGILNTLLHQPTIRLKERADDGTAQVVVDALRDLFDLDDGPAPEADPGSHG